MKILFWVPAHHPLCLQQTDAANRQQDQQPFSGLIQPDLAVKAVDDLGVYVVDDGTLQAFVLPSPSQQTED